MTNNKPLPKLRLLTSPDWRDYTLLDTGDGQALEQIGPYRIVRPEPQAIWRQSSSKSDWQSADAVMVSTGGEHGGYWEINPNVQQPWIIHYKGLKCEIRLSKSRHIGVFPEQATHWDWIEAQIRTAKRPLKVINLFGYTGMATAAAARTAVPRGLRILNQAADRNGFSGLQHYFRSDRCFFRNRRVRGPRAPKRSKGFDIAHLRLYFHHDYTAIQHMRCNLDIHTHIPLLYVGRSERNSSRTSGTYGTDPYRYRFTDVYACNLVVKSGELRIG